MRRPGSALIPLVCVAQLSYAAPLQSPPQGPTDADLAKVTTLRTRVLQPTAAVTAFARFRKNEQVHTMAQSLVGRGYKAETAAKDYFALEEDYRHPDGRPGKFSMAVQNYSKPNTRDLGAVAVITLSSGDDVQRYVFSLEAPGGDFTKAIEHQVDAKLRVTPTHSLWSCFKNRVSGKCASVCVTALASCLTTAGQSWVSYLTCLAVTCGGCAAKAFACCGCDCSWWCRWAVGCCDR